MNPPPPTHLEYGYFNIVLNWDGDGNAAKRWKGQCLYIKKWELKEIESRFQYMTKTPDELCLKAEATGKSTFVTLACQLAKVQTVV